MNGRLRVDVAKCDATLVLVHEVGGCVARDNPAKEAVLFSHKNSLNE
jgi:hypothetical protein